MDQVVTQSGLTTFTARGGDLNSLTAALAGKTGIDSIAPFGESLHVSGRDAPALEAAIAPYRDGSAYHWSRSTPSLEDVFIDLVGRAKDNYQ